MEKIGKILDAGKRAIVFDGAMGTILQEKNLLEPGVCPENLNLTKPEEITEIHKRYAKAGSDIVQTNTFGANRIKLAEYGLKDKLEEINKAGVENARKTGCLVAASIGPLGKYLKPVGELEFEEALDVFAEQARALRKADAIIIETISEIREAKAAIIAAKENTRLPIICSMTYDGTRTVTGTDVETAITILEALGVDIIGANCSQGPEGLYEVAKIMAEKSAKPILIQPNAGIPRLVKFKTVFDATPQEMAEYAKKVIELGVEYVGGCCGTTPEHLEKIASTAKNTRLEKRTVKAVTRLASRTRTIIFDKPLIIGERINPTANKTLTQELKKGRYSILKREAVEQVREGADLLDVNVGVPDTDEAENMKAAVEAVQNTVDAPIVIDTSNLKALEEALKVSDGKPLINSVTAEDEKLGRVFALAEKYGAAVVGLTIDEDGIPESCEDRVRIADRIIGYGGKHIARQDIIIDTLTLAVGADQERAKETLKAVKELSRKGVKTVLGVSNISHGLPNRALLNATFLSMAIAAGLSAAIVNPKDARIKESVYASRLLLGYDKGAKEYLKLQRPREGVKQAATVKEALYNAVLDGDEDILDLVEAALKEHEPLEVNDILLAALDDVGVKFASKEYFLPQVILSAEAVRKAFNRLKKDLTNESGKARGTVLLATVRGDVHDIGKNIVATLLETYNYNVIDLGKDVPLEEIIRTVKENDVDVIGLSALMTTTMLEMPKIVTELARNGIHIPVICGGAAVTADFTKGFGAEYSRDALSAVRVLSKMLGGGK